MSFIDVQSLLCILQNGKFHGIALWFDCKFEMPNLPTDVQSKFVLSTSPWSKPTHWKQTVIVTAGSKLNESYSAENEGIIRHRGSKGFSGELVQIPLKRLSLCYSNDTFIFRGV